MWVTKIKEREDTEILTNNSNIQELGIEYTLLLFLCFGLCLGHEDDRRVLRELLVQTMYKSHSLMYNNLHTRMETSDHI